MSTGITNNTGVLGSTQLGIGVNELPQKGKPAGGWWPSFIWGAEEVTDKSNVEKLLARTLEGKVSLVCSKNKDNVTERINTSLSRSFPALCSQQLKVYETTSSNQIGIFNLDSDLKNEPGDGFYCIQSVKKETEYAQAGYQYDASAVYQKPGVSKWKITTALDGSDCSISLKPVAKEKGSCGWNSYGLLVNVSSSLVQIGLQYQEQSPFWFLESREDKVYGQSKEHGAFAKEVACIGARSCLTPKNAGFSKDQKKNCQGIFIETFVNQSKLWIGYKGTDDWQEGISITFLKDGRSISLLNWNKKGDPRDENFIATGNLKKEKGSFFDWELKTKICGKTYSMNLLLNQRKITVWEEDKVVIAATLPLKNDQKSVDEFFEQQIHAKDESVIVLTAEELLSYREHVIEDRIWNIEKFTEEKARDYFNLSHDVVAKMKQTNI